MLSLCSLIDSPYVARSPLSRLPRKPPSASLLLEIARDPRLKMRENHANHGAFESSGSDASFGGGGGAGGAAVRARQGEQESYPEDADLEN